MPLIWRRIAWFASFVIAVVVALWMRSLGYGWPATLGLAVIIWVVLPFIISQLCAAVVLWRMQGRVRQAEKQEAVAKRMIDEALK